MRRVALATALGAAALVATGCEDETVLLASVPAADDAGRPTKNVRCFHSEECEPGFYCDKHTCDEPAGRCERFPAACSDALEALVCGCDGITYWNDCLRRAAGIAGARPGHCGSDAVPCGGSADPACPEGASCARLLGSGPSAYSPAAMGTCWVLPSLCPASTTTDRWDDCGPGPKCADTCSAARTEHPHRRAMACH